MSDTTNFNLELFLTHPAGFGLTTATPLQRAICRILDGRPLEDLANHPHVIAALGFTPTETLPIPKELILIAGIRSGKSLLAACMAIYSTQKVDVSMLRPGEIPRVSLISVRSDLATVLMDHMLGAINTSPYLKSLLVQEPTGDSIFLRHPTGRAIEIKVVAGSRAGATLVARWSAGVVLDEISRMQGQDEAIINWEEQRRAATGRMLPGAFMVGISSPYQNSGPVYSIVKEFHGKPSPELLVVRGRADYLNNIYWTPEKMAEVERKDPQAYRTDVLGLFSDKEESIFTSAMIDKCTRSGVRDLRYNHKQSYVAAQDPATRSNAWTLVIATKVDGKSVVAKACQWKGSTAQPLSPDAVIREIAAICASYGIDSIETDQFSSDALRDIADRYKLHMQIVTLTAANKLQMFENLRIGRREGRVELPDDPYVRQDLQGVSKKVTTNGVIFTLAKTMDGRHSDYAPAIAMALRRYIDDPTPEGFAEGTREYVNEQERKAQQERIERLQAAKDQDTDPSVFYRIED
jgi:hypothetical protein